MPSVVLDRLAVEVVEGLDATDHSEAAPVDLAGAREPGDVVRLACAVDEHRHAALAGTEGVGNPRTGRPRDDVARAERDLLDIAVAGPELECRRPLEDDEDLLLGRVAVGNGAAVTGREFLPAETCEPRRLGGREIRECLVPHGFELDLVDVEDVLRTRRRLADLKRLDGRLDVPRIVVAPLDPGPAQPDRARPRQP